MHSNPFLKIKQAWSRLLQRNAPVRTLFLDHFYCVVPPPVHLALKNFFLPFISVDSYEVKSDHGTWNGIYAFPVRGGFLEFIEESQRDPFGTHGIAFSRHGDEAGLHAELTQAYRHLKWDRHERKRQDGSTFYISSYPANQDKGLFLWGMEYLNDNGRRIRSKGEIEKNPIQAILSVHMKITEPLYSSLVEHVKWGAQVRDSKDAVKLFTIPQESGSDFRVLISPTGTRNSGFSVEIEVDPQELPKLEQFPELHWTLDGNILKLEYSGE